MRGDTLAALATAFVVSAANVLLWAGIVVLCCGCAQITRDDDSASSGSDIVTETYIWPMCPPKDRNSPPSGSRVEDSQEPSGQDPAGPEGGTSP